MTPIYIVVGIITMMSVLLPFLAFIAFFRLWIRARLSGLNVSFLRLVDMRLRRVNPSVIVDCQIMALKEGLQITTNELEAHYLAGGNVVRVLQALIVANKANSRLTFKDATAIDLAGRDVLEAVRTKVNPKVEEEAC